MSAEAVLERVEFREAVEPCLAMPVSELIADREILNQTIRFAGSVLVEHEVEVVVDQPINSLMDALHYATYGDTSAEALVKKNVATDLMERTIKAGFVSDSRMEISNEGSLIQHGQSYRSVQANSLRYIKDPVMRERVWSETKNYFRLEQLVNQGVLDQYSFVVFSLAEKDMPEHFFSDTQTLSIQVSRKEGSELLTQSAFIAGKDEHGHEHDSSTIAQIIGLLNSQRSGQLDQQSDQGSEEVSSLSKADILDRPWLIHNSLLPNGAIDLVKLYDDLAGGTFYGQNQPRVDYLAHQADCRAREQNYQQACDEITNALLAEADQLDSPIKAAKRLDQLSRGYSLKMAVLNEWIDPQVFGSVSARHIDLAREAFAQGDHQALASEVRQAYRFDMSSSCPGALSTPANRLSLGNDSLAQSDLSKSGQEDRFGPLDFYCPKGHLNSRPKNHLIDRCRVCKISVKCS